MMKSRSLALIALAAGAAAVAGCAAEREPIDTMPPLTGASADIRDSAGRLVARASFTQAGDAVRIRIDAEGLATGAYGAHVHAVGRCDPPGFESAGPHWNPTDREHGSQNPQGQHLGDLPNLIVGANGEGSMEYTIGGASLTGGRWPMLDADGAALMVHARADDYRSDPGGDSGARMACGVVG